MITINLNEKKSEELVRELRKALFSSAFADEENAVALSDLLSEQKINIGQKCVAIKNAIFIKEKHDSPIYLYRKILNRPGGSGKHKMKHSRCEYLIIKAKTSEGIVEPVEFYQDDELGLVTAKSYTKDTHGQTERASIEAKTPISHFVKFTMVNTTKNNFTRMGKDTKRTCRLGICDNTDFNNPIFLKAILSPYRDSNGTVVVWNYALRLE